MKDLGGVIQGGYVAFVWSHPRGSWRLCVESSKGVLEALCGVIQGGYGSFVWSHLRGNEGFGRSHPRRLCCLCVESS